MKLQAIQVIKGVLVATLLINTIVFSYFWGQTLRASTSDPSQSGSSFGFSFNL